MRVKAGPHLMLTAAMASLKLPLRQVKIRQLDIPNNNRAYQKQTTFGSNLIRYLFFHKNKLLPAL